MYIVNLKSFANITLFLKLYYLLEILVNFITLVSKTICQWYVLCNDHVILLDILSIVEHMKHGLETCRRNLLHHLERRRQIFPRFYFLSMEDVLHIVCNGNFHFTHNTYILTYEHVEESFFKCTSKALADFYSRILLLGV